MDDQPDSQGRRVYRMSELGGCTKAMVAKQLDYQKLAPPDVVQERFDAGHAAEVVVLDELRRLKWTLDGAQNEVDIEITPTVVLCGHVDGFGSLPGDDTLGVIEIKSMSEAVFQSWLKTDWTTPGLIQKYKWQVSAYMAGTGMKLWFVAYDRDNGWLDFRRVDEPFLTKGELVAKVLQADRYYRLGELPVECDYPNWPCPFVYLHEEAWDPTNDEVEEIAVAYKLAQTREKVGKEEKSALRKALDSATQGKSYNSERVKVTYFDVKGREGLDAASIEAAGLDPKDFMKRGKGFTNVKVTIREMGGDGKIEVA